MLDSRPGARKSHVRRRSIDPCDAADDEDPALDPLAPRGGAARRRADRRAVAGRLRGRPARRDDAAGGAAGLRRPGPVLRADLPDLRAARAGARRRAAPRRPEHEGDTAARADLRRRQDAYAGGAAPSGARPGGAAGPARGGAVPVARRGGAAAGARGGARLRQAGRREGDGGARTGRRDALAEAPLERARLPARGRGRAAGAAPGRSGRRAGDGAGRAAAGRPARAAAGRGLGDARA